MALNPNDNAVYNKATMDDLINDAVERADLDALDWLDKQSVATIERTRKGTKQVVKKGISAIRAEYRVKYLNYKASNKLAMAKAKERKAKKEEEARKAKFEEARKRLLENQKKQK